MYPRLEMRHLIMIDCVTRTGSVSAAASQLGLTQSALSHRIREAERRLNTPLFHRTNRRLVPTHAGKRINQVAQVVLNEVTLAERDVQLLSGPIEHVVRIGSDSNCGSHWVGSLLSLVRNKYPHIEVEVVGTGQEDPLRNLIDNQIDVAMTLGSPSRKRGLRIESVYSDELVALVPSRHPLSKSKVVMPEDFRDVTYIAYHTTPERGREYELIFKKHDVLPKKVIRAGVTEAVVDLVRRGEGVTILPSAIAKSAATLPGAKVLQLTKDPPEIVWHAVLRRNEASTEQFLKVADLFSACLTED